MDNLESVPLEFLEKGVCSDDGVNVYDCVYEQFTGFYDRNGKEIYEGDIIDLHSTVNGVRLFEVLWDATRIGWGLKYYTDLMDHRCRMYEYSVSDFLAPCGIIGEVEYEVIGNIHKNPGLLEDG